MQQFFCARSFQELGYLRSAVHPDFYQTVYVVSIETKFGKKNLDIEAFVPSDSTNPLKFNRVEGVGVSALIDIRVSGL